MRRRDVSTALVVSVTGAALLPRDAESQTCTPPCFARTQAEINAGVTPTNYAAFPAYGVDITRYGADPTGVADSSAALNKGSLANSAGALWVPPGTYLINSNVTVTPSLQFSPGAILRPANGVTITLSNPIVAGPWQIFNLSPLSSIVLPAASTEVWAEWWGAKGDGYLGVGNGATLNNEVYINQALNALNAGSQGVNGGVVKLAGGVYYIENTITLQNGCCLEGHGAGAEYPAIFANPSGWAQNSYMITTPNSQMFNSKLRRLRINASNQANIVAVFFSEGWQDRCGMEDVLIENFANYGFLYTNGIGGAATLRFNNCEFDGSPSCGTSFMRIDMPGTVGHLQVQINNTNFIGKTSQQAGTIGINVSTSVILNLDNVHFENVYEAIVLQGRCNLVGKSITVSPDNGVNTVLSIASGWTGQVNVDNLMIDGATTYLADSNRPNYPAPVPYDGHLVWPPDPGRPFATARCTGAGNVITYGYGLSLAHTNGTGVYMFTLSPAAAGAYLYDVEVSSDQAMAQLNLVSASSFTVTTRSSTGVATDCGWMSVKVYHSP